MIRDLRKGRQQRVRKRVEGTDVRPRLSVFRSNKHIYAQIINDLKGVTLISQSDASEIGTKKDKAFNIGKKIAQKAIKKKISKVVFDRGGFLYHGRVEEVAKGAREGGLEF